MLDELLAPLFATEWGRRSGLIALLLFTLFFIITFIQMPFHWRADYVLAFKPANIVIPNHALSDQSLAAIKQIPQRHLFGYQAQTDVPVTSLGLHLVGIIQANPENLSHVIISSGSDMGKIYQVGDTLPMGVRIEGIQPDGVILENNGRMEKLPLSRPTVIFQGLPKKLLQEE